MRESIGGSQVLMICVSILLVMIVVLSASIGYTKAFKARNAIVNIVQKYGAYGKSPEEIFREDGPAYEELGTTLQNMGYMISAGAGKKCENKNSDTYEVHEYHDSLYNFCIYQYTDNETGNQHYGVQTYMYFELPIFGRNDRFSFPLYADTYTFFKTGIDVND